MTAEPKFNLPDNIVSSIGDQLNQRRRAARIGRQHGEVEANAQRQDPAQPPQSESDRLKSKLLYDWRLVKRARFNAAKRLRNRYEAGQFAFAISGIYGFLVPLFLLQFDSYLTNFASIVISFVAAVAGALSFTIAMQYQQKDFKVRANQMHDCARRINNLSRHLAATQISSSEDLRPFIHHYDDLLAGCENHDDIDFAMARLTENAKRLGTREHRIWKRERLFLRVELYRQTYTICVIVWALPLMIGTIIWLILSPAA